LSAQFDEAAQEGDTPMTAENKRSLEDSTVSNDSRVDKRFNDGYDRLGYMHRIQQIYEAVPQLADKKLNPIVRSENGIAADPNIYFGPSMGYYRSDGYHFTDAGDVDSITNDIVVKRNI
jgi:hypothetical protein